MGLKHEAKKGTVIEVSGPSRLVVKRGSALVEIDAAPGVGVRINRAAKRQPPTPAAPRPIRILKPQSE